MQLPPPVIHTAKLIAYAVNDQDVEFTNKIHLYVGDPDSEEMVRLGEMPNIAICHPYYDRSEYLIFLCDEQWEPKGTLVGASVEDAKNEVERGYKGISKKWVDEPYSENEIDEYLREDYGVNPNINWWESVCSFCGKKNVEVEQIISSDKACICNHCIAKFHEIITEQNA